jgi:hypothetical protein
VYKKLNILESVYVDLLGSDFRYRLGILGPHTDLYYWAILNNEVEFAKLMWNSVWYPVRTAISAACLLRNMGERYMNVDPLSAAEMIENADYFEQLAVSVQNIAEDDESDLALSSLDCELLLWRGMALIDLAVESRSLRFLEECCPEAINIRLYGDLKANSSDARILIGVLSGGILPALFPSFLEWNKPPVSDAMRRQTQRRSIPEGYPHAPYENKILQQRYQRELDAVDPGGQIRVEMAKQKGRAEESKPSTDVRKVTSLMKKWKKVASLVDASEAKLHEVSRIGSLNIRDRRRKLCFFWFSVLRLTNSNTMLCWHCYDFRQVWQPTFSVTERWRLFMCAPITLFYANVLVTNAVTTAFTGWFVLARLEPDRPNNPVGAAEIIMAVYFAVSFLREMAQVSLADLMPLLASPALSPSTFLKIPLITSIAHALSLE